jgi:hypothetical protein
MMTTRRMAALLATAIAVVPMHAYAQDWGRILSDPNYLPLAGEFDGSTAYTYGITKGDAFDSTGAQIDSFHVNTNALAQRFEYGVTDDFALGLGIAYDPSVHRTVDLVGGSSRSSDKSGFADPTIDATYRVMDERRGPMILDLFATYSPDLFRAQSANSSDDGTVARGGQAASLGLALGREWPGFGIRATAAANWVGKRSIDDPLMATTLHENSAWNYDVALNTQARLTERASLNIGAGYLFRQSYGVDDPAVPASWTMHPGDVGNVHLALNYHFVPNRVVGSLTYQYNGYNHSSNTDATPAAFDGGIRNQSENVFGARLAYVLN